VADKRKPDGIVSPRRQRSIALGVLVCVFFAVTMVKGTAVLIRPM
jgi:hypothetical protein